MKYGGEAGPLQTEESTGTPRHRGVATTNTSVTEGHGAQGPQRLPLTHTAEEVEIRKVHLLPRKTDMTQDHSHRRVEARASLRNGGDLSGVGDYG